MLRMEINEGKFLFLSNNFREEKNVSNMLCIVVNYTISEL